MGEGVSYGFTWHASAPTDDRHAAPRLRRRRAPRRLQPRCDVLHAADARCRQVGRVVHGPADGRGARGLASCASGTRPSSSASRGARPSRWTSSPSMRRHDQLRDGVRVRAAYWSAATRPGPRPETSSGSTSEPGTAISSCGAGIGRARGESHNRGLMRLQRWRTTRTPTAESGHGGAGGRWAYSGMSGVAHVAMCRSC